MSAGEAIERLLAVMARLRDPEQGCPWDREQDFRSIAPYTIEEAYEVADAIARGDFAALLEELGDLLLQVVFHARMAEEAGLFGFTEVAQAISEKLIRRHPHVFGDARIASAEEQSRAWEAHKRRERGEADASALAGIAPGLPEWMRAQKLQKRAAEVGFDWQSPQAVLQKLEEELAELKRELERPSDGASRHERLSDELGDLFFVLINLSRHLGVDPGPRSATPTPSSSAASGAWRRSPAPMGVRSPSFLWPSRTATGIGPRPRRPKSPRSGPRRRAARARRTKRRRASSRGVAAVARR